MFITFHDRASDSPYIERVWRCHSERPGAFQSVAAPHWEMVVTRIQGQTLLTVRGPETRPTTAFCPAAGDWLGIRFQLGTFMPQMRPGRLRDRNDVNLPNATARSFWLDGAAWEYPDFENAEVFVRRLVAAGLLAVDPTVRGILRDEPQGTTPRTVQRRFQQTTGLTLRAIRQIHRARRATLLLQRGRSILDAVHGAGYYDQAHLTRAMGRWIGQTPGEVLRAAGQLSYLYNTSPD